MTEIIQRATDSTDNGKDGWMADVQRALALLIIGLLSVATFGLVLRLLISADVGNITDIAKIMLAAMTNMGLIALGFFFGSSKSKETADAGTQKIVDKLTSTAPPGAPGPIAPVAAPTVVVSWWSLLTEAERDAIKAAANTNSKAATFMAASEIGKASDIDLQNMVDAGLLTQDRATTIKSI